MKINPAKIVSIVLISSLLGLLANYLSANGIPLLREERKLNWEKDSTVTQNNKMEEKAFEEPKVIVLKQAYQLYNNNVQFVDARDFAEYEIGHIKGAISLPYYDYENYQYQLKKLHSDEPIVVYCDGKECDLSILLGDKLFDMGYKKVYIFFGGWVDWQLANYPIEGKDD